MSISLKKLIVVIFLYTFLVGITFASNSDGMPWISPLEKITDAISGPVAKFVGVICIIIAGLGIAMGEAGGGTRKLFQVVMGLAIAFTATSIVTNLFGASSGAIL